ncbi:MAG: redox-sensing transcriptional repressor Rex [Kiritimatiellia bacterium]
MSHPREVVNRLARYKNALDKLRSLGLTRVFSDNLADVLGVSAALVRKDFSVFGLSGNKRGGYKVEELISEIGHILGRDEPQKVIIVGCGKIGTALMNYNGFSHLRVNIVAGFDVNPAKFDAHAHIPIHNISQLPAVAKAEEVHFAILTVPEAVASGVVDVLLSLDIRGILNFTPMPLKDTGDCVIHNINIALELENLFYLARLSRNAKEPPVET